MKRQYLLSTEGDWQSMFGQGLLVFRNESGSGRKLTLKTLDVTVTNVQALGVASAQAELWRCASASGEDMARKAMPYDSSFSIPAGVVVRRGGGGVSPSAQITNFAVNRSGSTAGTQNGLANFQTTGKFGFAYRSQKRVPSTVLEPITVNTGEAIVLMPAQILLVSVPVRVEAIVSIDGKTVVWDYFATLTPGLSAFSLENSSASVVKLLALGFSETGTTDTPYLRLVPVGQVYALDDNDASRNISSQVQPMDSNYPALPHLKVNADVGFVPKDVPENYMTDTTAGTPRGFNYLHTKDFNGPVFRVLFPEYSMKLTGSAGPELTSMFVRGMKLQDIGIRHSGLSILPGEGLAIVASAETAVAVQASYSGWPTLRFNAIFEDEPQYSPFLNITGLQTGSDIVVLQAGTGTILQQIDAYSSTSWAWNYDPDTVSSVDVCIYKAGFVPLAIRALPLTVAGASIPVAQTADRNYS